MRARRLLCCVWLLAGVATAIASPAEDPPLAPAADEHTGADIVDLYDRAVAHLEAVCDDYRRIRAIQLARQRDLPFEDAYENISSVMPLLAPVNKPLLRKAIRKPEDIVRHKNEVETVQKEIEMMIDLVAKLLKEIEAVQAELLRDQAAPELTLEEIVQRPELDPEARPRRPVNASVVPHDQSLEQAARQDDDQPAKDLTPIMHRLLFDIQDLTREAEDEKLPPNLFRSSNDLGALRAILDPKANKAFGRKITSTGDPAEWLFVDTWYTIGPFPNPQRINIHRKFPPETVIDLDATYVGKDGREIRWQWVQSHDPMVTPADPAEYAIYYAYTEIWCERPMDLWVAVGSDDKANVWLNGMPIWISGDQLKGWRMDEGFRKVTFQAGINRVLYRVENGWLNLGFSMGIRVAP